MTEHSDHNERQQTQIADDTAPTANLHRYLVRYSWAETSDVHLRGTDDDHAAETAEAVIRARHPRLIDLWIDEVTRLDD